MNGKLTKDSLLTRGALAKALGVSIQEVQRRLRVGSLVPHTHRGTEPVFTYAQYEEQRMLSRKRMNQAAPSTAAAVEYSGEDASVVFKALREGKTLDDIVIEASVHPLVVRAAAEAFAQLRGGLFVSAACMSELEKMPIDGEFPVQGDVQLIEMLRGALIDTACSECRKRKRKVCLACAKSLARKGKGREEDDDVD